LPPEHTLVQERRPYDERYDVRTDAIAVYGIDGSFPQRAADWKARGYRIHVMTGLAWGDYQDYVLGRWDGRDHWDEAQHRADNSPKQHGADTPYMVPTEAYARYLEEQLQKAIDAGAEGIFLEEPEFWSYTGHGPAFRRAWQAHYGEPWRDPSSDPLAWTMAARLKHQLYHDLIARLCKAAKAYGGTKGREVRCYVATHSPLNYSAWAIVSPELSLRAIPEVDGCIVQTWSFTARSQTIYEGRTRERLFAVAFLEYGSGIELVRGMDRHLWLLTDPVEDRPNQGWETYRFGYHATVAAALCWPEVGAYEVMPWPGRVFAGRYPHGPDGSGGEPIPQSYAGEILAIANALRAMPTDEIEWDRGTGGTGVLFSDTMLFRRGGPQWEDPQLSAFYGLALPLLLAGMPVRPVGMEALAGAGVPADVRVLLLSYDGMTPPDAAAHQALAQWVRDGGALLCFGSGQGPYETLPDWWNDAGSGDDPWHRLLGRFGTGESRRGPWPDLFGRLGLGDAPATGFHRVGQGVVLIEPSDPRAIANAGAGAGAVRARLREALAMLGPGAPAYLEQDHLVVRRGPYLIAAVLAEGTGAAPLHLTGRYVDLFDGDLPVRDQVAINPGDCTFLLDLNRLQRGPFQQAPPVQADPAAQPACVVAAAARIEEEAAGERSLRFRATGPTGTTAVIRLRLPAPPKHAIAGGGEITTVWDAQTGTALLRQPNTPHGVAYEIAWQPLQKHGGTEPQRNGRASG
jgi:hypothetical protein